MSLADIDHIVIVIMENRSFDHMLGYLSLPGPGRLPVEGFGAGTWLDTHANLHAGVAYRSALLDPALQVIDDPPHGWAAIQGQITTPAQGGGRMGGFVESYACRNPLPSPEHLKQVMGYYGRDAVPVFDFFAHNYVVCDHWFAALPAGTQPNRLMAMAGESKLADNASLFLPDQDLVYDWLNRNGVEWCAYQWGGYFPFFSLNRRWLPQILGSLTLTPGSGQFRRYSHFAASWAAKKAMPSVIFIEPEYGDGPHSAPNDDHPPTGVAQGQAFLADIYTTLISNRARWAKTMMIVTYDEHGGFFDHVPPIDMVTQAGNQTFATTGVRVPAFVISPQVNAGQVFNANLDHTSLLELMAEKFTPGHGYSLAVNARQGSLDRLSRLLQLPPAHLRAPQIPHATASALRAAAAVAPLAPQLGASVADPPNAQALHQVALTALNDHPELMANPAWAAVRSYAQSEA